MIEKDLVSIIMPTYNSSKTIESTIKSVISQTYTSWELLIVDDCSNDGTTKIIFPYLKDERIKLIELKKNKGAANSRNIALALARGRWVAFLDSDDLWRSEKLQEQITFMRENNYNFTCTKYEKYSFKTGKVFSIISAPRIITKKKMFLACYPGCLTVIFNREAIGLIQIDPRITKRNDYAIWLKISKKFNCHFLDKNLATYRVGDKTVSSGKKISLVKHHYRLFRLNCHFGPIKSVYSTLINIIFTVLKKVKYETRV